MTFRSLSGDCEPSHEIAAALRWVHAAGQPYVDWLLDGSDAALRILAKWLRRQSSEVFIGRAVVVDEPRPIGGFIALSGVELASCRMHDAVAAAAAAPGERRSSLIARLRVGHELFGDVRADDFYLSRMGVLPHARRCGYGTALVDEYLRQGIRRGFGRFTLDVSAENDAAIDLYRSAGFAPRRQHHAPAAGMTYLRMVLEVSRASFERLEVVAHPPLSVESAQRGAAERDGGEHLGVARVIQGTLAAQQQAATPR
jgi:ribosomal protein S18 acetylase RimI-like enzyme